MVALSLSSEPSIVSLVMVIGRMVLSISCKADLTESKLPTRLTRKVIGLATGNWISSALLTPDLLEPEPELELDELLDELELELDELDEPDELSDSVVSTLICSMVTPDLDKILFCSDELSATLSSSVGKASITT